MLGAGRRLSSWVWGAAAVAFLAPAIAMQFSNEMNWDKTDFILWGTMLAVAAGTFDLASRMTGKTAYRMAVGIALLGAFLLIWMNLAVGIIGSEDNPANLMYAGVLAIGLVGAFAVRFRPRGMALTLGVMALAQLTVGVIALSAGLGSTGANWPRVIYVLTAFFAASWLLSAWLFHRASRDRRSLAVDGLPPAAWDSRA